MGHGVIGRGRQKSFSQDPSPFDMGEWSRMEATFIIKGLKILNQLLFAFSPEPLALSITIYNAVLATSRRICRCDIYLFDPLFTLCFFFEPPLSLSFLPSDTSPLRMVKRPMFPVPVVPPTDAAREANSNSFFRFMCFVIS